MTALGAAVALVSAAGVLAGGAAAVATASARAGIAVMLELWTAAGLLRLGGDAGWDAIGAAAMLVAVRKLVGRALQARAGTS